MHIELLAKQRILATCSLNYLQDHVTKPEARYLNKVPPNGKFYVRFSHAVSPTGAIKGESTVFEKQRMKTVQ